MTAPAPLTDSERIAALEAEVGKLHARLSALNQVVDAVNKSAGYPAPPIPGVGVTRLARRPNPAGLHLAAGGAS